MDREYSDGEDYKNEHKNKSKERRYERALRTRNVNEILDIEEEYMGDSDGANLFLPKYQ